MKKSIVALIVFALLLLMYSFLPAQNTEMESDIIILSYTASGSEINVYKGGADEKPISCKKRDVSNCVVELLSSYKAAGYKITSRHPHLLRL